ncbi:hypothetical protein ACFYXM_11300 [Streptomyces sp. NPDC002476]|uniref:hypothetical protein n=1 Tax=Streptomyces sp. NPDC002476 TaxID=3364648 RepID=UPI003693C9E4
MGRAGQARAALGVVVAKDHASQVLVVAVDGPAGVAVLVVVHGRGDQRNSQYR